MLLNGCVQIKYFFEETFGKLKTFTFFCLHVWCLFAFECCHINSNLPVGKKMCTKYQCMVNVTITESFIEPHTALLLKGTARVMDFSQGAKYIFKKLFLQFFPLIYLTYFYTNRVILFSCQSNLLLNLSDGVPTNKRLREAKNCS